MREHGISRTTAYKWIRCYESGLPMTDKSRRPFHNRNKIPPEMEKKIVDLRLAYPSIGAAKLHRMLQDDGEEELLCVKIFNNVLKRNKLITREDSEAATPYVRFQKDEPNAMWQMDYKGNYLLQDGQRCHPHSVEDDFSRFCLCADAKEDERFLGTKQSLEAAFRTFGLPQSILCDNGNPWGASQSSGITKFEVWLMDQGVLPTHIRFRHPQTQGKIERFNGSFKRERLRFYTPRDMVDAQAQKLEYMDFYNQRCPHYALNLDIPASHYIPSARPYLEQVPEWEYEPDGEQRQIKSSGYVIFQGQGYFLGEGMGEKTVFLYPSSADGVYDIVYRQFTVARLSVKDRFSVTIDVRPRGLEKDD